MHTIHNVRLAGELENMAKYADEVDDGDIFQIFPMWEIVVEIVALLFLAGIL